MASMHDQILAHLSPVETLLATAVMNRQNPAKLVGMLAGGLIGGLIAEGARSASTKHRGTLADRLGHPDTTHGVVTTHRVVFFADHKFKIGTLGKPIVGYGREHLVAVTPDVHKVTDSQIRLAFSDGSDLKLLWRKRKEVAPWVAAIEQMMSGYPDQGIPQGYRQYVLPPGV